jgi:hypothetical protein
VCRRASARGGNGVSERGEVVQIAAAEGRHLVRGQPAKMVLSSACDQTPNDSEPPSGKARAESATVVRLWPLEERPREVRLPDARVCQHEHHAELAGGGTATPTLEHRNLAGPTDQAPRRHVPIMSRFPSTARRRTP